MQIKRQRVAFSAGILIWLVFFGIQKIVLEVLKNDDKLTKIFQLAFPIVLLVFLIGMFLGTKYFVRDDMITITERDEILQRIVAYIAAVPVLVLIFIEYLIRDNPNLVFIINIIGASILIVIGLFGGIYFTIVACQKPKIPFKKFGKTEEADFKEKDNNFPN
ncbi:MAG TPA: hypothetical protein PLP51_00265 [Acholeplasmataceae bacterium]|jgi:hypothetical protein|nr:hypothetical protein [Acholeplasmataceae bacterium]HQC30152.1 hypothetical protein [Acholeplasmataceae bacterium]